MEPLERGPMVPQPHGGALLGPVRRGKAQARVIKPSLLDIAWAAAIFEGEGCASRGKGTISVSQKRPWILLKLRARFGGTVRAAWNRKAGLGGRGILMWHWAIFGFRARGFAMTVYRFLSPHRKTQVRRLLAFRRTAP